MSRQNWQTCFLCFISFHHLIASSTTFLLHNEATFLNLQALTNFYFNFTNLAEAYNYSSKFSAVNIFQFLSVFSERWPISIKNIINKKARVSKWLKRSKQNFTLVSVNHLINDFRSLNQGYLAMFKYSNFAEANAIKISPGTMLLMFELHGSKINQTFDSRASPWFDTHKKYYQYQRYNDLSVWGHGFPTWHTGGVSIAAQQRMWMEHMLYQQTEEGAMTW